MTESVTQALLAAAELVDAIGDQAERDRASWNAGYRYAARTFFDLGVQTGRMAAEQAEAERWAPVAEHVRRTAGMPTRAELETRRSAPGGDAYFAALLRYGGTEFAGVGKPRVPAPPGAYQAALAWAEQRQEKAA